MNRRVLSWLAVVTVLPATIAAQATAASTPVTISGELRARTEWDQPGDGPPADAYTFLRTRLGLRADPNTSVRIFLQLQDSRVYGGGATAGNTTDLHQAYADISGTAGERRVTARIGRQEIALGNERLIGPSNFSNTGRSLDGVRVLLAPAGTGSWTATAFAATTAERGRTFGATSAAPPADRTVIGAYLTRASAAGGADVTFLYDFGGRYRDYSGSDRYTLDARYRSPASARFDVDAEFAFQGGTQNHTAPTNGRVTTQDVSAWLTAIRAGRFSRDNRSFAAFVAVEALSGDASPTDGTYSAFNTMYPTNHGLYGTIDLFPEPTAAGADLGFVDAFGSVSRRMNARTTVRADLHRFIAQKGNAGELGWELDLTAPIALSGPATLELGYAAFRVSSGGETIGLGRSGAIRQWAYAQLRATF